MMSYAVSVTSSLNWVVRSASEVETNIVSVERVMAYGELAAEAPDEVPEKKPPTAWPQRGAIEFSESLCHCPLSFRAPRRRPDA